MNKRSLIFFARHIKAGTDNHHNNSRVTRFSPVKNEMINPTTKMTIPAFFINFLRDPGGLLFICYKGRLL
jgi:hypothetical protein